MQCSITMHVILIMHMYIHIYIQVPVLQNIPITILWHLSIMDTLGIDRGLHFSEAIQVYRQSIQIHKSFLLLGEFVIKGSTVRILVWPSTTLNFVLYKRCKHSNHEEVQSGRAVRWFKMLKIPQNSNILQYTILLILPFTIILIP